MTLPEKVELQASEVSFFSDNDESSFFEWLKKIPCVEHIEGKQATLYITVNMTLVDEECLREFLALFRRFAVPMRQLCVFDRDEFASWFRDRRAYWHEAVFGILNYGY